ncbi:MAG: hypothetical protein JNM89_09455 [Hyphomicrobiaceae bacterium]|nr:hypothetical protein [Hyphomicrobiaceae bacterium]
MIEPRRRQRWKPQLLVMLVLFIGAAVAGVLLLPGDAERVAMLERDGSNERALKLLEQRFAAGDRSQRTLYQLEQLYAHFGQLPKARTMLERLAAARPGDLVLQRRLVTFYRETQDTEAYLSSLSRLLTRRYSEPVCRELVSGLRLIGHFARERDAIERCRHKGYRRIEDIVRLAELEAANGNLRQATTLLRKVDEVGHLEGDRERLTLLALLSEGGEPREIVERVLHWIAPASGGHVDDRFALLALDLLGRRQAFTPAMEIARKAGKPGDAISLGVAHLLLDQDQTNAARAYLRGWLEQADHGDRALAEKAIRLALDAEDPSLAFEMATRTGLSRFHQPQLVALAEALAATGKRAEFDTVRLEIASETITAHPLLGAMIEFNRGATSSSRELLDTVSADALGRWRLALWARLMRDSGEAQAADTKLRSLGVVTASLPDDKPRILQRRTRRISLRLAGGAKRSHAVKLTQGKRGKAANVKNSAYRSGGAASRPAPVARPLAAVEKRG